MSRKPFFVLWMAWIALLVVTSCTWGSRQFYDNGVSDQEYISIARVHHDAQVFLEQYPLAETYVDRSGRLAVDFRVTSHPITSTTQAWEGIRLRVFIDPKTKRPADTLVQCNDSIVKENVQQYLEHYFTTQTCP